MSDRNKARISEFLDRVFTGGNIDAILMDTFGMMMQLDIIASPAR